MARFHFRLAPVLQYRQRLKEEKLAELQPLEEEVVRLTAEIQSLIHLLDRQTEEMAEQDGQILSVGDLRARGDFTQRLGQRLQERRALLAAVQQQLADKRAEVVRADRAVKTLEQLCNRWQERHRRREAAVEQRLIDEIGQGRYRQRVDQESGRRASAETFFVSDGVRKRNPA